MSVAGGLRGGRGLLYLLAVGCAIGGLSGLPAVAQEKGVSGHLSAVSSGEAWRQSPEMEIQTRDEDFDGRDGPRVAAVREAINEALSDRGITVAQEASQILRFEISSVQASADSPPPQAPLPGDPEDAVPTHHPPGKPYRPLGVAEQVTVPLTPDSDSESPADLSISFVLFEPGERPVWRATVTASGDVEDRAELLRGMTRIAMATLGDDFERDFTLNCSQATGQRGVSCHP